MAAIFLTPDNLAFVKAILRQQLPEVKSSHRIEAFAASAGYRTHAALLADVQRAPRTRPALVSTDPILFTTRLAAFGYGLANPPALNETVRSAGLPDPHWRAFRNGDTVANERWYRTCQRHDIPNIYIETRRKYVKLNWDCISIQRDSEGHVRGNAADALVHTMFNRYQALARPDPGKSEFFGSAFVGSIDRLLPEIAYEIADALFKLLYEPMRQRAAA